MRSLAHSCAPEVSSSRLISTTNRTISYSGAYAPFGEPYAQSGTADPSFTGQRQDTVAGPYDFPAREYSYQGRWPSPDPAGLDAVDPSNPQSWNRYAYVMNNPLALIDPDGLDPCQGANIFAFSQAANGTGIFSQDDCIANGGTWGDNFLNGGGSSGGNGPSLGADHTPGCIPVANPDTFGFGQPLLDCNTDGSSGAGPIASTSSGFISGIKDKFLNFLSANANYLRSLHSWHIWFFHWGWWNAKGGVEGGVLVDKQIGKPPTVHPIGEVSYGPVGVGVTPSEALVFVQPLPKFPLGQVFAADWHNGFINNSGISIGFFAGKPGHKKGLAGGFGGGAHLTISSAANCVKNF